MKRRSISIFIAVMLVCIGLFAVGAMADEKQVILDDPDIVQPTQVTEIDGEDYYEISQFEELLYIAKTGGQWLAYNYILTDDIVMNDAELSYDSDGSFIVQEDGLYAWTPIDGFEGIFDGDGYTISGMYISRDDDETGLFGCLAGDVYNLEIVNSYVRGGNDTGGIAGGTSMDGSNIINCSFDGAVVGLSDVGGIVGNDYGTSIAGCINYGSIWGEECVGGIVGEIAENGIDFCINSGDVNASANYAGGIVGFAQGYSIGNSENYGDIFGSDSAGGIVGEADGTGIFLCGNRGNVYGRDYTGGICGYLYILDEATKGNIYNSFNTGSVDGNYNVGGITGKMDRSIIEKTYNIGNVSGRQSVGGIAGSSTSVSGDGEVTGCYYLQTDVINSGLYAFGNSSEDVAGVAEAEPAEVFPVYMDEMADPSYIYLRLPHTVTFNVNGGDALPVAERTKQVIGCDTYGTLPVPTRTDYGFDGWFTAAYGGTRITENTESTGVDITLYAHWHRLIDINRAVVKLNPPSFTYDGSAKQPALDVTYNGSRLTQGTDYDATYSSNTNAGTAKVTIRGKGNYTGSKVSTFIICFTDVPITHNYQKAVYWATDQGIAAGYTGAKLGLFGIGDNITRGQVAMFLWRAAGQPAPAGKTQTFTDVPTTSNFYKAIQWAYEQGITGGYTGSRAGQFGPSDNCTRGQIVMFLWRYAGKPAPAGKTQTFTDVPTSSNFYKAVQWASEQGITAGYKDGSFGVNLTCTRGHCVTFLYRLLGE